MIKSVATVRGFLATPSREEYMPATTSREKEPRISDSSSYRFYQVKEKNYGEKIVLWGIGDSVAIGGFEHV
jgi:hypothetical protein